jgi:hypothetical protein
LPQTYIKIRNTDGTEYTEDRLISFSFRKDAYLPYTLLSGKIVSDGRIFTDAAEIFLCVEGFTVHHGLIDQITTETSGGICLTSFVSRGFTSLLCQNQLEPGMITGVSINSLMDSFYTLPYVTHENNSDTSSYIYVSSNSTMWDGVVNLSYKLCGTYPYIRGDNCVRITPFPDPESFSYTDDELLSAGSEFTGRRLMSHFHMADISGHYGTYDLTDSDVTARKIIRHKYFELDMEFLNDPQQALAYRDKYVCRAWKRLFCKYSGYNGEDISDTVTFNGVSNERISAVTITGNSSGITTSLSVYHDRFT